MWIEKGAGDGGSINAPFLAEITQAILMNGIKDAICKLGHELLWPPCAGGALRLRHHQHFTEVVAGGVGAQDCGLDGFPQCRLFVPCQRIRSYADRCHQIADMPTRLIGMT